MKKPLIGITCNYDPLDKVGLDAEMGLPGQDWNFVAGDYIYAIEKAGGIPVILPRLADMSVLEPLLEQLDGILVTGGHDVGPYNYHTPISGKCGRVIPLRDAMDLAIAGYALGHKKPVLGICRGIQILNVASGGTLYQDLESEGGFLHHFLDQMPRNCASHTDHLMKGSLLEEIFGKEEIEVNSFHHQAVRDIGPDTEVMARSLDGVIESIRIKSGHPFSVGVQWHPEMMYDSEEQAKIFQAFIRACRE